MHKIIKSEFSLIKVGLDHVKNEQIFAYLVFCYIPGCRRIFDFSIPGVQKLTKYSNTSISSYFPILFYSCDCYNCIEYHKMVHVGIPTVGGENWKT